MQPIIKIATIVGLITEFFGLIALGILGHFLRNRPEFIDEVIREEELSQSAQELVFWMLDLLGSILGGFVIFLGVVFVINAVLFIKLINERFDEETQHKVFFYQSIWGGINIAFNQAVGIAYLISGLSGLNIKKQKNNKEI